MPARRPSRPGPSTNASAAPPRVAASSSADFFRRIANPIALAELFDVLPHIFLFVKDRRHRYTKRHERVTRRVSNDLHITLRSG